MKHMSNYKIFLITIVLAILLFGCVSMESTERNTEIVEQTTKSEPTTELATSVLEEVTTEEVTEISEISKDILEFIPDFTDEPYVVINDNMPDFTQEEKHNASPFEEYSEQDRLGRCGVAYANICTELMPTEERGEIGHIKPSGWKFTKYDIVEGKYLYNRCHLIGYQLAGENANEKNLITGTRYFNKEGMMPFENRVADYVKYTENHVLYRVTPIYSGDELLARGVQIEAYSVEDGGEGICFNVFVYNNQPGVEIDYSTGESKLLEQQSTETEETTQEVIDRSIPANNEQINEYVLNTNTRKFHVPTCDSVKDMKEKNKKIVSKSREEIIADGYDPCKRCNP